jgi:hypothetical protein
MKPSNGAPGLGPQEAARRADDFDPYLTGAERREWMGLGVAGMIIDNYCGSFPKIPCV